MDGSREPTDNHRYAVEHEKAIAALRQGAQFETLVSYIRANSDQIPIDQYQSYRLLCKLLLKQGRLRVNSQKDAFQIIGIPIDLEIYFIEYGMIQELADLYLIQRRHTECFELLSEHGLLERALEVSLDQASGVNVPEKTVLKILDYVWAGHYFIQSTKPVVKGSPEIFTAWESDAVKNRNTQWELVSSIKSYPSNCRRCDPVLADIEDSAIRYFRSLLEILQIDKLMSLTHFDQIPFDAFRESVKVITKVLTRNSIQGWTAILLLVGVWPQSKAPNQNIILAWSPLHEEARNLSQTNIAGLVKDWITKKTASAFLTLHAIAKDLWKSKWPTHCQNHLSKGCYSRTGKNEYCARHHGSEPISRVDCRLFIKGLLHLNKIFCSLAPLYYTRAMPETFQQHYLGIRRYWVERLLRALTYVSSFDQDASVILHFQTRLFHEKRSLVTSVIEEHLYFQLGEDWIEKAGLSWLLEQTQFAQTNTRSFQIQHSRAIFSTLRQAGGQGLITNILSKFHLLEENAGGLQHRDFQTNLKAFLLGFDDIHISNFSHMHAITATLESLAVYLILMTCSMAYVVPRSWVSLHMPSLIGHVERAEWLDSSDVDILRDCLLDLVNSFTRLLWRVDQGLQDGSFSFLYGRRRYPPEILQQRNVQLLAISIMNIAEYQPQTSGVYQAWSSVQKVLRYPTVNLEELQHETIDELGRKLALAFKKYGNKNNIEVVTKDGSQEYHFKYLHQQPGVEHRRMNDIRQRLPRRDSIHLSPKRPIFNLFHSESKPSFGTGSSSTSGNNSINYTSAELQAVTKIQKWWRRRLPRVSQHKIFLSSPKGQALRCYTKLCAKYTSDPKIRNYLLSKAAETYSQIIILQHMQSQQLENVLQLIVNADLSDGSSYENMDALLREARQLGTLLETQVRKMSATEVLTKFIKKGDLEGLEQVIEGVETKVNAAEKDLSKITLSVSKLSFSRRRSWPET